MSASWLETEIRQQPEVLEAMLARHETVPRIVDYLRGDSSTSHVLVAARGTSDNAARYLQYLWATEARQLVSLAAPSTFTDPDRSPRLDGAAVIGISQSGESPDIVAVLAAARAQKRPAVAITNRPDSPLAHAAGAVLDLVAGEERSVAATKTYTASLMAALLLADGFTPDDDRRSVLAQIPALLHDFTESMLATRERFVALNGASVLTVSGRGLDFGSACETALKVRELSGTVCEAFSPPDLKHGPIAALRAPGAAWVIDTGNAASSEILDLARFAKRNHMISLAVGPDPALHKSADIGVAIPPVPWWAGPFFAAVAAQAAGLALAEATGRDVDAPPGLTKITLTS